MDCHPFAEYSDVADIRISYSEQPTTDLCWIFVNLPPYLTTIHGNIIYSVRLCLATSLFLQVFRLKSCGHL
jgi:hypothetical protein